MRSQHHAGSGAANLARMVETSTPHLWFDDVSSVQSNVGCGGGLDLRVTTPNAAEGT